MNYAELTQSIQDYTENDETTFVAEIPTFVRQTEEKIHRTVLIPELRKNVTANITQNVRFVASSEKLTLLSPVMRSLNTTLSLMETSRQQTLLVTLY